MAALTPTAGQVLPAASGVDSVIGLAAETLVPGQSVYLNASNQWALSDANASAVTAAARGVTLTGAGAGQKAFVHTGGDLIIGAAAGIVVGTIYIAGATPGTIHPHTDLVATWYVTVMGVGKVGNILAMPPGGPFVSGQLVP